MPKSKVSWEDSLAAHEAAVEEGTTSEVETTPWIKFPELGSFMTGRVVEFFETRDKDRTKTNVKVTDVDGNTSPMGLGGNLSSLISHSMVDHILHIVWVDVQDVGKQSPMKVFRVFDYGDAWPPDSEPFAL